MHELPDCVYIGIARPAADFGRTIGVIRTTGITRTRGNSCCSVPAVVGITGLALGRTVAPIGLAAVRTAVVAPVPAVVSGSDLTLARTIVPVLFTVKGTLTAVRLIQLSVAATSHLEGQSSQYFFAVIGNIYAFPDMAVVGVGHLADRRTWRRIIFGAAVLSFRQPRPDRHSRYIVRRSCPPIPNADKNSWKKYIDIPALQTQD